MTQNVPIFKVAANQGKHPRVGLDRPVCIVGRKDYVNLPLPAKEVSKLHALIVREQRRVYLRDLASTNGVEVNGERVNEVGLSDADIVRIGSYTLRCHSGFGQDGERPGADGNGAGASASSAPTAELRGKAGNFSFPPGRHTLLIGQRDACEVRLKHPSVAPVHAVVFEMDGRHYVQTFAPEIATRVNGRPIHREALQPGDELLIGEVALRYALVDLAAETSGASGTSMTDTGDSLIKPALDSSIAPAIDPSHHGEIEPEDHHEVAIDDVLEGSHESLITPAMESSVAPAMGSGAPAEPVAAAAATAAPPAAAPVEEEDYGLEIEPLDEAPPAAEAADAKTQRPAEPPHVAQPPAKAIGEPVIEPVVERAMESGIAAAIDPIKPAAAAGAAAPAAAAAASAAAAAAAAAASAGGGGKTPRPADDLGKSMHGDDDDDDDADIPPFDLEPAGSSAELEPIGLHPQPEPLDDGELEESFRANWNAAAEKKADGKLSATFDEDNELEPVIELTPRGTADDGGLSATFDEEDGMIPLGETDEDAGLLRVDDMDLARDLDAPLDMPPPPSAQRTPPAASAAASASDAEAQDKMSAPAPAAARATAKSAAMPPAQPTESPLLDSIAGAAPTLVDPMSGAAASVPLAEPTSGTEAGKEVAVVAEAQGAAVAAADAAAAASAADAAAAVAGVPPVTDDAAAVTDPSSGQAAKLAELAKAAGLGDDAGRSESGAAAGAAAAVDEITALVEEVAERSQELKEAWSEFYSENGGASTSASTNSTPRPMNTDRAADAPPASS